MHLLQEYLEASMEEQEHEISHEPIVPNEKKKEHKKRPRDPDAPKAPLSAYLLFSRDKRIEFKESHSELESKDVMKEIARQWRELDPELKKAYNDEAETLKQNHAILQAEYEKSKKNGKVQDEISHSDVPSEQEETKVAEEDSDNESDIVLPAVSDTSSDEEEEEEKVVKKAKTEPMPVSLPKPKKVKSTPVKEKPLDPLANSSHKKKHKKKEKEISSPQLDAADKKQKKKKVLSSQ